MPQERLTKLEQQAIEHNQKIGLLESGFESIKGLTDKLEKLTEAMISNTHSNKDTMKMQERIIKRQDSSELDSRALHDEIAAARPAIKLMNELSKKMMYFGLFMFVLSVSVAAYVLKG